MARTWAHFFTWPFPPVSIIPPKARRREKGEKGGRELWREGERGEGRKGNIADVLFRRLHLGPLTIIERRGGEKEGGGGREGGGNKRKKRRREEQIRTTVQIFIGPFQLGKKKGRSKGGGRPEKFRARILQWLMRPYPAEKKGGKEGG